MSRKMQDLLGWIGFGPALVPPEFWRRWHNVAHHAHTNLGDKDPDSFGTLVRYEKHPGTANFTKLAPGGRTWYSYLFLFYSFMFHAQLVLRMQTRKREEFKGFNRTKAIRQSYLCMAAWIALGAILRMNEGRKGCIGDGVSRLLSGICALDATVLAFVAPMLAGPVLLGVSLSQILQKRFAAT